MAKKKNPAAVALAKLRLTRLSSEERSAVGRAGAAARHRSLTPEERREIARKAGQAGGRGRKKKQPHSGSPRKQD
jgi:hypothetical protein